MAELTPKQKLDLIVKLKAHAKEMDAQKAQQSQAPAEPKPKFTDFAPTFQSKAGDSDTTSMLKTVGNIPSSAARLAKGFVSQLDTGAVSKAAGAFAPEQNVDKLNYMAPSAWDVAKELPGAAYQTLVPQSIRELGSGLKQSLQQNTMEGIDTGLQKAKKTLIEDPYGQAAIPVLAAVGVEEGIKAKAVGKVSVKPGGVNAPNLLEPTPVSAISKAQAPGILDTAISKTGKVALTPLKAVTAKSAAAAATLAKYGVSSTFGLDPATVSAAYKGAGKLTQAIKEGVNRASTSTKVFDVISEKMKALSDSGKNYDAIRTAPGQVAVPPNFVGKVLSSLGIDMVNGKIKLSPEAPPLSPGDVAAIEHFYSQYGSAEVLSNKGFLNLRKALDDMSNWDAAKTDASDYIAKTIRKNYNDLGHSQIKGLEALDAKHGPMIKELGDLKREFIDRKTGQLKDSAINKIANATGVGKDNLIARLEKISPGISEEIRLVKAIEDTERSSGNKVGTYSRSLAGTGTGAVVGGAIGGPAGAVVGGAVGNMLTHPKIGVNLAETGGRIAKGMGDAKGAVVGGAKAVAAGAAGEMVKPREMPGVRGLEVQDVGLGRKGYAGDGVGETPTTAQPKAKKKSKLQGPSVVYDEALNKDAYERLRTATKELGGFPDEATRTRAEADLMKATEDLRASYQPKQDGKQTLTGDYAAGTPMTSGRQGPVGFESRFGPAKESEPYIAPEDRAKNYDGGAVGDTTATGKKGTGFNSRFGQRNETASTYVAPENKATPFTAKPAEKTQFIPEKPKSATYLKSLPAKGDAKRYAGPLDIPHLNGLGLAERAVEQRYALDIQANLDKYVAKAEKRYGKTVNTDDLREFSTDYAPGGPGALDEASRNARSKMAPAVHEPSSALAKEIYRRKLVGQEGDIRKNVAFLQGGPGSGKTSALKSVKTLSESLSHSDIVYDGTLDKLDGAADKIDQALNNGNTVKIFSVARDPIDALVRGTLPRAMEMGRAVLIDNMVKSYFGVEKALDGLVKRYKDNPNVEFIFIDNTRGHKKAAMVSLDKLPRIEYTESALREALIQALDQEYATGNVTREVYEGTRGRAPEPTVPEGTGGARGTGDGGRAERQVATPMGASKGTPPSGTSKSLTGDYAIPSSSDGYTIKEAPRRLGESFVVSTVAKEGTFFAGNAAKVADALGGRWVNREHGHVFPNGKRGLYEAAVKAVNDKLVEPPSGFSDAAQRRAWVKDLKTALDENGIKYEPEVPKVLETAPVAELGPGHAKLHAYIDELAAKNTFHSDEAALLKKIYEETDDTFLSKFTFDHGTRSPGVLGTGGVELGGNGVKWTKGEPIMKMQGDLSVRGQLTEKNKAFAPSIVFVHEVFHVGWYSLLDDAERVMVEDVYGKMMKTKAEGSGTPMSAAAKMMDEGTGSATKHLTSNVQEFFAQSGADYLAGKRYPAQFKALFDKVYQHMAEKLRRLLGRHEPKDMERLQPLFDSILKGEKSVGKTQFGDTSAYGFTKERASHLPTTAK